jgi:hypothetical protein
MVLPTELLWSYVPEFLASRFLAQPMPSAERRGWISLRWAAYGHGLMPPLPERAAKP